MDDTDPPEAWLPTSAQILMASERAILATLDTTLLLAVRTLRAEHEHADLGQPFHGEPGPPHLALAESILILADSLRELIAAYRAATDQILRDG